LVSRGVVRAEASGLETTGSEAAAHPKRCGIQPVAA
jgi:hypothetical protein